MEQHKHIWRKKIDQFAFICRCGIKIIGLNAIKTFVEKEYLELIINKKNVVE